VCAKENIACKSLLITLLDTDAKLCVQLDLEDCAILSRRGLGVDVPQPWRLASASVTPGAAACVPDELYASSVPVTSASGRITWDETAARPSAFQLQVELSPTQAAAASDRVPATVKLTTDELLGPADDCG